MIGRREGDRIRLFAVDGGTGGRVLSDLAREPRVTRVWSPLHADTLAVFEPLSAKLADALREIAQAIPQPAQVLVVGNGAGAEVTEQVVVVRARVPREAALAALHAGALPPLRLREQAPRQAETIPLPPREQLEVATELVVHSLGPVQPFTEGPVRVLLTCDGEQVLFAQIETGYVPRMPLPDSWSAVLGLLEAFAPRLCVVRALEKLCGTPASEDVERAREAALRSERARETARWKERMLELLGCERVNPLRDGALRLRTTGIGRAGAGVPERARVLIGEGGEDVHGRLVRRLAGSRDTDLPEPALSVPARLAASEARAEVQSARGPLAVRIRSSDTGRPLEIAWQTPSAAALPFVASLLEGQKLADAGLILASLDICAAEVDA